MILTWQAGVQVMDRLVCFGGARHTGIFCVPTPRRARARGGVRTPCLLGGECVWACSAVVVAGVRLEGAEGARSALVCGGGVGLGTCETETVSFCFCCVDEARVELVLWTRRAGGADAAVGVFVADAARDALVTL